MNILAVDTSDTQCAAALVKADGVCVQKAENIGRGHAERLLPMVDELLAEAALRYADLGKIAVITGPGTFTGLRIGLSVARGLALALSVPCVGVMSLPVLAADLYHRGHKGVVHATVQGRGGQLFYQAYSGIGPDGMPVALADASNIDACDAASFIRANPGCVVGTGVPSLQPFLCEQEGVILIDQAPSMVGLARLAASLTAADFLPEPAYLRAADAIRAKAIFTIKAEA